MPRGGRVVRLLPITSPNRGHRDGEVHITGLPCKCNRKEIFLDAAKGRQPITGIVVDGLLATVAKARPLASLYTGLDDARI